MPIAARPLPLPCLAWPCSACLPVGLHRAQGRVLAALACARAPVGRAQPQLRPPPCCFPSSLRTPGARLAPAAAVALACTPRRSLPPAPAPATAPATSSNGDAVVHLPATRRPPFAPPDARERGQLAGALHSRRPPLPEPSSAVGARCRCAHASHADVAGRAPLYHWQWAPRP
nr:arabinogalactan protein 1-like [Aegilops tauschii subsp. strangulata]